MPTIVKCPICRKEVAFEDNPFRPFCSERCKLIDLGAWAGGKYRIPGEAVEQDSLPDEEAGDGDERKRPN